MKKNLEKVYNIQNRVVTGGHMVKDWNIPSNHLMTPRAPREVIFKNQHVHWFCQSNTASCKSLLVE
ncbi:hypothetical protein HPG69_019839 [Diceros bicornis minor]|uniref:Uncharacterized protein n=1 Tax=Diceros bicornis minor TaxID=77932 RepID=A0A7J7EQT6_DICBM|nr:hypothetical protein HPG69_019839 [Diceros bicornis minor]